MLRSTFAFGGALLVAAALVSLAPGPSGAAPRGGFHAGGFGGYRGFHRGGYPVRHYFRAHHPGWQHYRHHSWGSWGYYPSYDGYYPNYDYSYPYSGHYPYYDPAASWGSGYGPGHPGLSAQPAASAQVTVTVPASARVWFDGTALTSTATVRQYVTPPLAPGRQFTYWVRARWNENGRELNQLQPVEVMAGGHFNVHFPAPPRTGG